MSRFWYYFYIIFPPSGHLDSWPDKTFNRWLKAEDWKAGREA